MTPANGAESSDPVLAETALAETALAQTALAETYLRLVTETELRRALASPRVRSPADRRPPAAVLWASRAAGAILAAADLAARPVQPAARRAGQAMRPWTTGAARFLAPPARRARWTAGQVDCGPGGLRARWPGKRAGSAASFVLACAAGQATTRRRPKTA